MFKRSYCLPSLATVKTYIKKNNHLIDMPSENEVKKNGVSVREMLNLQTKKIEEFTLYIIEQQARIIRLEKRLNRRTVAKRK